MSTMWLYLLILISRSLPGMGDNDNPPEARGQCKNPTADKLSISSDKKEPYEIGDVITLECEDGYRPSSRSIICQENGGSPWWNVTAQCIGQCKKPTADKLSISSDKKEPYEIGDVITLECVDGYRPSSRSIICQENGGSPGWNVIAQCIGQCKNPTADKLSISSDKKEPYEIGDVITLECEDGYRPSSRSIICQENGGSPWWNVTAQCIGQCKKPTADKLSISSDKKEPYEIGDVITLECVDGYRPLSRSIICQENGGSPGWNVIAQCIAQCKKPTINNGEDVSNNKDYYSKNEKITVRCKSGYYPSLETMTCENPGTSNEWTQTTVCIAQCKKPTIKNMQILHNINYYYKNEEITVRCQSGYYPLPETMRCENPGTSNEWTQTTVCIEYCKKPTGKGISSSRSNQQKYKRNDTLNIYCETGYSQAYQTLTCVSRGGSYSGWNVQSPCIAQCKKPTINNGEDVSNNKDYYSKNEKITVRCKSGYYPSLETMTCENPGTSNEWTQTTVCIAQCKKPTIENVAMITNNKEYYSKDEEITVQCIHGYYALPETMRCLTPRTSNEWTQATVCIEIKVLEWRVTSTEIQLEMTCRPDSCQVYWRFSVSCCTVQRKPDRSCQTENNKRVVTFRNLEPFSQYEISVGGYIKKSPYRKYLVETIRISTKESVPGTPKIQKSPSIEDNTIKWRLSQAKGNITGFQLNITAWREYNASFTVDESHRLPPSVTEYKIPLQHGTNYTVTLRGFTSVGAGGDAVWTTETPIGEPPRPLESAVSEDYMLQLHPVPDLHGPISYYEIIIFTGQEGNSSEECLRVSSTYYNFSQTPSIYTAAVLTAQNLSSSRTIIMGDEQHYGGFFNAPLIPNHNYTVYVRVTSQWKQVKKSSCALVGFFVVKEPPSSTSQVIAGSVTAVVLLLILLILGVLWKIGFYRKSRKSSDIPLKDQSGLGKKKDIPVDSLLEVVKKFQKEEMFEVEDGEEEYSHILPTGRDLEYKKFPAGLLYPCNIAQAEVNQTKNRYKKVIPYDASRVVLRSSPSGSDYINASYIDGYKAPRLYIATQGPLPGTLADFWSMVWQENCSGIVMLTGLEEQNKVKCERYWPEQTQTYGDITVSVQKIIQTGAIITRSFSLKKVQSTVQMTVQQLHYLQWPDHGVPSKPSGLVQLVEQMNRNKIPGSGPVIIHCSAGIGRTGTFMALDILLKMASAVKKVNVYNCVLQLRNKRVNMVQNKEQYSFLYDILLETLLCGVTSVPVSDIEKYLHRMTSLDPRTNMSGCDREFQALEKITELYKIYQCKEAKKPENQCKNRNPKILPGDHCRPLLMSALTREGTSGYINAVFVNSNSLEDVLVVTQLPMKQTLADFWSLVWDYKCTSVVMMHKAWDLQEIGSRFWPDKGETSYGCFNIRTTAKKTGNGYTGTVLRLKRRDETSIPSLEVNLWQLNSWPLDKPLPQNPGAIISLIDEVEKCQKQMSDSHILVTCCDGASRSGLFCAGLTVCDQIRSDGYLDVSQVVRALRRRRCQFIPTTEQYSFCYTLAQSYLDSFETYGNFK